MTIRVPFRDTAKGLLRLVKKQAEVLEGAMVFHALDTAYEHATGIAPVLTGKARYGLNPTAGRPMALNHTDGTYPKPGPERMLPLRESFGNGVHGFLVFHAHDKAGVFDYAGKKLDKGFSPKAPFGVLGPTKAHVDSQGPAISARAVADTERRVA